MQTKKEYIAPMTSIVAAYTASLMAASGNNREPNIAANVYDTNAQDDDYTKLKFGQASSGLLLESKGSDNAWDSWDE